MPCDAPDDWEANFAAEPRGAKRSEELVDVRGIHPEDLGAIAVGAKLACGDSQPQGLRGEGATRSRFVRQGRLLRHASGPRDPGGGFVGAGRMEWQVSAWVLSRVVAMPGRCTPILPTSRAGERTNAEGTHRLIGLSTSAHQRDWVGWFDPRGETSAVRAHRGKNRGCQYRRLCATPYPPRSQWHGR